MGMRTSGGKIPMTMRARARPPVIAGTTKAGTKGLAAQVVKVYNTLGRRVAFRSYERGGYGTVVNYAFFDR